MGIGDIVGMLGVILLLIAYFFLQCGKFTSKGLVFSLLNLAGSLMILFSLYYEWNFPAAFIEIAWALISIFGIVRWFLNPKKENDI